MAKKPELSPEDLALFLKAIAGTQQLKKKKIAKIAPKHFKKTYRPPAILEENELIFNEKLVDPVSGDALICYKTVGLAEKTFKKLRRGEFPIEDSLDLHGMRLPHAKASLQVFLQQSLAAHLRVLCVIHGKGRAGSIPVLKNKLNHWLRDIPTVLGFCSAKPIAGGSGAIIILLAASS